MVNFKEASYYKKLPNKKFDIIYADPPWHYNGKMQFDKSGKCKENINFSKKIFVSSLFILCQKRFFVKLVRLIRANPVKYPYAVVSDTGEF